jgi:hypothetical protein
MEAFFDGLRAKPIHAGVERRRGRDAKYLCHRQSMSYWSAESSFDAIGALIRSTV